jgi:hypothetical protein
MDLGTVSISKQSEEGVKMYLRNPATDEELKVFFVIMGTDSSTYKRLTRQASLRVINKKRKPNEKLTEAELIEADENDISKTVALIKSLGDESEDEVLDYILYNKKPIKNNESDLTSLLRAEPWIREQIEQFSKERANFLA